MPTDVLESFMEKEAVDSVEQMRSKLAAMQEKLDTEVKRAELATMEKDSMERRLEMKAEPLSPGKESLNASVASTQIMRVVEHWIRHRDLEEVNVRRTGLTDESFATLVHVLQQSPSLTSIDLSDNELTNTSVSDIAQLLTSVQDLQMLSVARNSLPLGTLGYLMTAMLERQACDLEPPVLINFTDNQGLLAEENHGQEAIAMQDRCFTLCNLKVSLRAANLLVTVSNTLWKFLVDTGHPLLPYDCGAPNWAELDETTHGKLLEALRPIVVYEEQVNGEPRSISAWIAIAEARPEKEEEGSEEAEHTSVAVNLVVPDEPVSHEPEPTLTVSRKTVQQEARQSLDQPLEEKGATQLVQKRVEKSKTFNIKQIVTKNGMILMNILDRMLETTSIDATDVETDRTLLEYSAMTGNMSLAKLCFRRGMNMSALTKDGNTAFNIATKRKDYQMMEFLHMYGVKVNSADAEGRTALHVATSNNDIDGICRLIEWGSDINLRNQKKQTPLHFAAMGGYMEVAMLLLELSAELNAKDEKNFTAVAHAEATDHFELMDRLVQLGGKHASDGPMDRSAIGDKIGKMTQPKFMRKSTSLTRMQKLPVALP
jgi:ankyrin repeat protein